MSVKIYPTKFGSLKVILYYCGLLIKTNKMDEHISKDNNNPINWDGNNRKCKLCDKDSESFDEYCEDHQRCYYCGDNDDCDCEEEH